LVAGLGGRVIDVGAGNGLLFDHIPTSVTALVAVEPNPYLAARALEAAAVATVEVSVVSATASALPLPDAACDAAVCSLVLCSVPDLPAALAEIRRVLRPGGELRFYEHVVATAPRRRRWQRLAEPAWSALVGGCRLTRDPVAAIGEAGFEVVGCEPFEFRPTWTGALTSPHVLGVARR
jgi:SAM-dependent methyltransferase